MSCTSKPIAGPSSSKKRMSLRASFSGRREELGPPPPTKDELQASQDDEEEEKCTNLQLIAAGSTLWALQLVWSTIFARGTTYLTHIGLPLSTASLLWISGPLAGMLVQPLMGALSDSYTTKHNKRKPFILLGAITTSISMLGLAFTPNLVIFVEGLVGSGWETTLLVMNAGFWVCALSISVQPLQGGIRTLLSEIGSKRAQARFQAWQGVLVAFGTVCGYFLASMPLGKRTGSWMEIWRFQNLCGVVAVILLLCSAVTVLCPYPAPGKVMDTFSGPDPSVYRASLKGAVKRNLDCLRSLPRSLQLTLQVQFFSWLGWFPALYYQTAYLASLYRSKAGVIDVAEQAALDSMPFTVAMFITAIILAAASQWSDSHAKAGTSTATSPATLSDLWFAGHILFALTMAASLFAVTEMQGVWIFALIGIPRALSTWVPFALIGREVTISHHAGTLTSLHNAALSAPQILAAGLCAVLFMVVKFAGGASRDQTRWAMSVACIAACLASWRGWHLRQEVRRKP